MWTLVKSPVESFVYFIIINRLLHIVCYVVCQQILSQKTEQGTHTSILLWQASHITSQARPFWGERDWYKKTGLNIGKWSKCYALTSSKKWQRKEQACPSFSLTLYKSWWWLVCAYRSCSSFLWNFDDFFLPHIILHTLYFVCWLSSI